MHRPLRQTKTLLPLVAALVVLAWAFAQDGGTRSQDIPRRLLDLRRDLRVAVLWVAQSNDHPLALRAGLESGGRLVSAITLNPNDGTPLALEMRNQQRLGAPPKEPQLLGYLRDLRQDLPKLKFGAYLLPSPRGHEVQIYWAGKLVSYLYIDPNNGNANVDETSKKELGTSLVSVR